MPGGQPAGTGIGVVGAVASVDRRGRSNRSGSPALFVSPGLRKGRVAGVSSTGRQNSRTSARRTPSSTDIQIDPRREIGGDRSHDCPGSSRPNGRIGALPTPTVRAEGLESRKSGVLVNVKMTQDDRRAIDLLLDRSPAASAGGQQATLSSVDGMNSAAYLSHETPIDQDSVHAVQQVLSLLSLLPDEEPPLGLVERTLARIDQSTDGAGDAMQYRPELHGDRSVPPA